MSSDHAGKDGRQSETTTTDVIDLTFDDERIGKERFRRRDHVGGAITEFSPRDGASAIARRPLVRDVKHSAVVCATNESTVLRVVDDMTIQACGGADSGYEPLHLCHSPHGLVRDMYRAAQ